jgi:hypothetical protein
MDVSGSIARLWLFDDDLRGKAAIAQGILNSLRRSFAKSGSG